MAPLVALIPARSSTASLNQRQESAPVSIHGFRLVRRADYRIENAPD